MTANVLSASWNKGVKPFTTQNPNWQSDGTDSLLCLQFKPTIWALN